MHISTWLTVRTWIKPLLYNTWVIKYYPKVWQLNAQNIEQFRIALVAKRERIEILQNRLENRYKLVVMCQSFQTTAMNRGTTTTCCERDTCSLKSVDITSFTSLHRQNPHHFTSSIKYYKRHKKWGLPHRFIIINAC